MTNKFQEGDVVRVILTPSITGTVMAIVEGYYDILTDEGIHRYIESDLESIND